MSRLFPLKAGEGYFDAGVLADGRQALMAAFYDACFAIVFDRDGAFVEYVERPTGREPDKAALRAWQSELGFTPQTIRVQEFFIEDREVGIEELPWHYQELLDDPDSEPDPDERAEMQREIAEWVETECFVLHWGNDLWLDGTGHVTSS